MIKNNNIVINDRIIPDKYPFLLALLPIKTPLINIIILNKIVITKELVLMFNKFNIDRIKDRINKDEKGIIRIFKYLIILLIIIT